MSDDPEITNYRTGYAVVGGSIMFLSLICYMAAIAKADDAGEQAGQEVSFLLVCADLTKWVGIVALVVAAVCHVTEIDRYPPWRRRRPLDHAPTARR
jgi:hypothetical protein